MQNSKELANIVLGIEAVKFNPETPFTWASGYRMPVYNDNRLLMGNAKHRMMIAQGFRSILEKLQTKTEVVAGTATAGIAPAATLADLIQTPLIYVRPAPKSHGLGNQIEGILKKGQSVIVVEDLVSTGSSSLKAIEAVRKAGGIVEHCLCIFTYGFQKSFDMFEQAHCQIHPLLTLETLIDCAKDSGTLNNNQILLLKSWQEDPFTWGTRHGFQKA